MSPTLLFLLTILPGTLFLGIYDVFARKILSRGINEHLLLGAAFFVSGAVRLVISFIYGIPALGPGFWPAFGTTVALNVVSQTMWFRAFKHAEASLVSPFRLLTPFIVIATGFLVLGESPSPFGIVGMCVTMLGLWFLLYGESRSEGGGIRAIFKNPGVRYALGGAILFAVSFPFDKQAVLNSSALFFSGFAFTAIGLASLVIFYARQKSGAPGLRELLRSARGSVTGLIAAHAIGSLLAVQALNYALAAYASSVKGIWPLWTVLFSGALLKEKHIGRKLFATAIMLAGVIVTVVLG